MMPLQINPESGFLESTGKHIFSSAMKFRALELARENLEMKGEMPDIPATCKALGIKHNTFYDHLRVDEEFKAQWEEVLDVCEQELVKTMYANGRKPSGYMDRITWLRAHRPGKWNPDFKLNINTDGAQVKGVLDAASTVIDAVIVNEPKSIDGESA